MEVLLLVNSSRESRWGSSCIGWRLGVRANEMGEAAKGAVALMSESARGHAT